MSVIAQAKAKGRQLHKFGGSQSGGCGITCIVAGIMAGIRSPDDGNGPPQARAPTS